MSSIPTDLSMRPEPKGGIASPRRGKGFSPIQIVTYPVLAVYTVVVVYPLFWLLTTSLKKDSEIFFHPFRLPGMSDLEEGAFGKAWSEGPGAFWSLLADALADVPGKLQWVNFANAWVRGHFGQYFYNSVTITFGTVATVLLVAAMAAYALSRFVFPGVRPLFFYFLAGLMIPLQLAIVPLFFQLRAFDMLSSRFGLYVVYVAFGLPFAIFILTGFFRSLPSSLHESALIDGATEFGAFWLVMLPLARPGLITVGIFSFLATWNEFFMAFMFLSGEGSERIRTLPLGLANITIVSQYRSDWGMAFAGLTLMMLPALVLYVLLQRHLTKGITVGALKG